MLIVASVCFFLIILKTCHGEQTDTTHHYWPRVFWPQPITLHPDHALPSELHFPSLNQQSPFQMTVRLCASLILLASPSSTQPHFSLIDFFLSQSQSWELSTLTAHLSSTCPGHKPSSHFICLPVLCCANSVHLHSCLISWMRPYFIIWMNPQVKVNILAPKLFDNIASDFYFYSCLYKKICLFFCFVLFF